MNEVFIYDAIRTARTRAKASGGLHPLPPQELLKQLYEHLVRRTGVSPDLIQEVILGCVTQHADQAGNIARNSVLYAGWPHTLPGLTVNRFCSSSVDAISIGALKVASGQAECIIAGGVEMMSRVPLLSDQASIFVDPAFATRCQILLMGNGADLIATRYGVSREECDAVALLSQQRAAKARDQGYFASLVPIADADSEQLIATDECIRDGLTLSALAGLAPAFDKIGAAGADAAQLRAFPALEAINHVHTAGNSPAMCDGAATVLIGSAELGSQLGITPRARLLHAKTVCAEPLEVVSGCVKAAQAVMADKGMTNKDIELFELHEAFAATTVMAKRTLSIEDDKLNVNGGVIALGHPMGATGAMMTGTLLDEMERTDRALGLISASGAAGSGSALLIERI